MLKIESVYNISIPDADLTPENFATARTIERLTLLEQQTRFRARK